MIDSLQGRCPSCGSSSLFVGEKGYITCALIGCKNPGAAHDLLAGDIVSTLERSATFYENRAALLELREAEAAQMEKDLREIRESLSDMAVHLRARIRAIKQFPPPQTTETRG